MQRWNGAADCGDVGMIQRSESLGFTLEAREPIGVVGEGFGEDLDRDVAIQLRVAGAKDLPHTPFANRRDDVVDAESGTGSEGQIWRDYTGERGCGRDRSSYTPQGRSSASRKVPRPFPTTQY